MDGRGITPVEEPASAGALHPRTPADTWGGADPDELEEVDKPRRSLWGLVVIIVLIIIAVVVLLMLRDCDAASRTASGNAGKTIERVRGMDPVQGMISVWVAKGTDVGAALAEAEVAATGRIDMGGGRWVVDVAPGTEERAVKALKQVRGVHDAGRVYER